MVTFIEVLRRAHDGPLMSIGDWDLKVIHKTANEIVLEHGLKGTYDPKNPISSDNGLADEFFRAGFEMAVRTGMYCIDTRRVIKYEERELKEAVKERVTEVTFGTPPDEVKVRQRRPEEKTDVVTAFGPMQSIDEDVYVSLHESIAQHKIIGILQTASLDTIYGVEVRAGTPIETLVGMYECALAREATARVGRPGMPLWGPDTSPTEHGLQGSFGIPRGFKATDVAVILGITELKTSYSLLHKVAHLLNVGAPIRSFLGSMYGGYPGPIECVALTAIAGAILLVPTHQSTLPSASCFDALNSCTTTRPVLWGNSIVEQALSKNIVKPVPSYMGPNAGPCTDMLLRESALDALQAVASGCGLMLGIGAARSQHKNHSTGLESKSTAEIAKAAIGIKRSDVNEIAKEILPKYEDKVKAPPKGNSFLECYNPRTLEPSKEWAAIYERVQAEFRDLGVPLS